MGRPLAAVSLAASVAVAASVALAAGAVDSGCGRGVAGGRADGGAIFGEICARCHGPDGVPDAASAARIGVKPLVSDRVQRQMTDAQIRRQILEGSPNKQMPSFEGALTDPQIDAVIAHVRTLRRRR